VLVAAVAAGLGFRPHGILAASVLLSMVLFRRRTG
jgi:hypothetical protein